VCIFYVFIKNMFAVIYCIRLKSTQNTSEFLYLSIGRIKEGVECPRKEDSPGKGDGEPPINNKLKGDMYTRSQ
jgi:hypothetical protein